MDLVSTLGRLEENQNSSCIHNHNTRCIIKNKSKSRVCLLFDVKKYIPNGSFILKAV